MRTTYRERTDVIQVFVLRETSLGMEWIRTVTPWWLEISGSNNFLQEGERQTQTCKLWATTGLSTNG